MQGQDIAVLLRLSLPDGQTRLSKDIATDLFLSPSEVSKSLKRSEEAGLIYLGSKEKRVNRTGLLEFLAHGFKYTFPPKRGSMVRGLPTSYAAEPLKSQILADNDPLPVWPYPHGTVRGVALDPLYKGAPKAALHDSRFYSLLALCDAIRSGRTRERNLAIELLGKELNG
jgi:hypothetical protein